MPETKCKCCPTLKRSAGPKTPKIPFLEAPLTPSGVPAVTAPPFAQSAFAAIISLILGPLTYSHSVFLFGVSPMGYFEIFISVRTFLCLPVIDMQFHTDHFQD